MSDSLMARKVYRSRSNKWVAGILGGLAESFGWNAKLLRLLFVLSILLPGPQVLAYAIAWVMIPKEA